MTSASIITDDHKAHHSARISSDFSTDNYLGVGNAPNPGFTTQRVSNYQHPSLANRNSFSTPDLQSLQLSSQPRAPQSHGAVSNYGDQFPNGVVPPSSRNGSRPASPSGPGGPQTKRRKGSGTGPKVPPSLAMTKLDRNGHRSPPIIPPTNRPSFPGGHFQQPYSPQHSHQYGYQTLGGYHDSNPSTPGNLNSNVHARSQSYENLQTYSGFGSAASSAWQSQVPSAESSPQPYNQPPVQARSLASSLNATPSLATARNAPVLQRIIPADGPIVGGIEIACFGEGFDYSSRIFFGEAPAVTIKLFNSGGIACILPPAPSPRTVNVTVQNTSDHFPDMRPAQDNQTVFKYSDNSQDLVARQTLQMLHQQFAGGSLQEREYAQSILAARSQQGHGLPSNSAFPSTQPHNLQSTNLATSSTKSQDLESAVLHCLEAVDLDDRPCQVDLNQRNIGGQSLLHLAAFLDYYRVVAGLLARGADVDVRDNNGMTPMHLASLCGNLKVIRKLRASGADPTIRSLDGKRPADMALTRDVKRVTEKVHGQAISRKQRSLTRRRLSRSSSATTLPSPTRAEPHRRNTALKPSPEYAKSVHSGRQSVRGLSDPASWSPSRGATSHVERSIPKDLSKNQGTSDALAFASSHAMWAWKEHINAQIQQLQHNLQRALPLMTLPDYQAYPVMRRISNLVPQRTAKTRQSSEQDVKPKHVDYHWWELITGVSSSPPAYEDIYPDEQAEVTHIREASDLKSGRGDAVGQALNAMYDTSGESALLGTVNINGESLTRQQQEAIRVAHARKVKKLRSDRNLFFVWVTFHTTHVT